MNANEVRTLNQQIANSIAGVVGKTRKYPNINYWRLYLDGNILERGVDTCATSQVTSVLCRALKEYEGEVYDRCLDMICKSLFTVIRLRDENGAWPSVIDADELMERRNSGDNAIGDTYFALTTLFDVGFLNDDFKFGKYLSAELSSLDKRIDFVSQSISWLIDNKARNGGGWYYTDNADERIYSVALTTTNILQIFIKISSAVKSCSRAKEYQGLVDLLTTEIKCGIDNLLDNSILSFTERAIGVKLNHGTQESLVHTCKLFNLLISLPSYDNAVTEQLLNFIIANVGHAFNDRQEINEEWLVNNYGFEKYSIQKFDSYDSPLPRITIDHENYVEGILLTTLIGAKKKNYSIDVKIIDKALNSLIVRCKMGCSNKPPLFACHSNRDNSIGYRNCPVYSSYEAYMALEAYADSYNLLYSATNTTEILTTSEAISFKNTLEAQILRLTEYKNDPEHIAKPDIYGLSIKDCDPLIESLNAILEILSDSNYIEQQTIYNDTLLQQIQRIL